MGQIICFFGLAFFLFFNILVSLPYQKPAHLSQEIWDVMAPYFLPEKHPIRKKLDKIFSKGHPTANYNSLLSAGFTNLKTGAISQTTVGRHPKVKNYILKMITEDKDLPEWEPLKKRIEASNSVRKTIKKLGYENYFVVPQKWIYPLPNINLCSDDIEKAKNFILIAEEMDIYSKHENERVWHKTIDQCMLTALHRLISIEGLQDSVLPCNIPFTRKGKIAFVDLEHYQEWPIPFHKLLEFLNPRMQYFWSEIVD